MLYPGAGPFPAAPVVSLRSDFIVFPSRRADKGNAYQIYGYLMQGSLFFKNMGRCLQKRCLSELRKGLYLKYTIFFSDCHYFLGIPCCLSSSISQAAPILSALFGHTCYRGKSFRENHPGLRRKKFTLVFHCYIRIFIWIFSLNFSAFLWINLTITLFCGYFMLKYLY